MNKDIQTENQKIHWIATGILPPPSEHALNPMFNPLDSETGLIVCSNHSSLLFFILICSSFPLKMAHVPISKLSSLHSNRHSFLSVKFLEKFQKGETKELTAYQSGMKTLFSYFKLGVISPHRKKQHLPFGEAEPPPKYSCH